MIALARSDHEEAERRLDESIAGWERLLQRTVRAESITTVLADLGRPVVGLIEPERELARARADREAIPVPNREAIPSPDREAIPSPAGKGERNAVVP